MNNTTEANNNSIDTSAQQEQALVIEDYVEMIEQEEQIVVQVGLYAPLTSTAMIQEAEGEEGEAEMQEEMEAMPGFIGYQQQSEIMDEAAIKRVLFKAAKSGNVKEFNKVINNLPRKKIYARCKQMRSKLNFAFRSVSKQSRP